MAEEKKNLSPFLQARCARFFFSLSFSHRTTAPSPVATTAPRRPGYDPRPARMSAAAEGGGGVGVAMREGWAEREHGRWEWGGGEEVWVERSCVFFFFFVHPKIFFFAIPLSLTPAPRCS